MTTPTPHRSTIARHAAVALLAGLTLASMTGSASAADYVSKTFDQRGEHQFVVPGGVRSLQIHAIGEQGGGGTRTDGSRVAGGWGGDVTGSVFVTPKRAYWIEIGTGGAGGGGGQLPGGKGGGASVFRVCRRTATLCEGFGSPNQSRVIVAAGGGGTAGGRLNIFGRGGNADAPGGQSEVNLGDRTTGGLPGTQTTGGLPGVGFEGGGGVGLLEYGGAGGGNVGYAGGGGGGGGYFGGGGGGASSLSLAIGGGGGGGGSNHVGQGVQGPIVKAATTPDPSVTLTWYDDVAPAPSIGTPANGDVVAPGTALRGTAGKEFGDSEHLTVAIHAGRSAVATEPLQTLQATRDARGDWSVQPSPLSPGTYTAVATQRDDARNTGSSTVTFSVVNPTPTPTVTPAPATTPAAPQPPAPPAQLAPRPQPAVASAAIRIDTRRARLTRGTLSVRLTCTGPAGQRCTGVLTLTAKSGKRTITLGSTRYAVTAGRTSTVRVRVRPAALKKRLPRRVTVNAAANAVRTIAIG